MVSMSAEPSPSGARVTTTADAHARLVARAGPFAASVFVSLALIAVPDERGVLVAATTTRALAGQLGVAKDTAAGALAILMRRGYLRRLAQPRSGGRFASGARYVVRPPDGFEVVATSAPSRPCPVPSPTVETPTRRPTPVPTKRSTRTRITGGRSGDKNSQLGLFGPAARVTPTGSPR